MPPAAAGSIPEVPAAQGRAKELASQQSADPATQRDTMPVAKMLTGDLPIR